MLIHAFTRKATITVDLPPRRPYLFTVNDSGDVVCEVKNADDARRLLLIPEAYREYGASTDEGAEVDPLAGTPTKPALANPVQGPIDRSVVIVAAGRLSAPLDVPEAINLTGNKAISREELVQSAYEKSGLTVPEWNDLDNLERAAYIADETERLEQVTEQAEQAEADRLAAQVDTERRVASGAEAPVTVPENPVGAPDPAVAPVPTQETDPAAAAELAAAKALAEKKAGFVLTTQDGQRFDFNDYSDKEMRTFAAAYELHPPKALKGDELRYFLVNNLAPK